MKKITILFAVLITVGVGFTVSAFNTKKAVVTQGWFRLTNPSDPYVASSYTYTESPCSGDEELCAIMGTRNSNPAILTPTQGDVDAAAAASGNFAYPVTDIVAFEE